MTIIIDCNKSFVLMCFEIFLVFDGAGAFLFFYFLPSFLWYFAIDNSRWVLGLGPSPRLLSY